MFYLTWEEYRQQTAKVIRLEDPMERIPTGNFTYTPDDVLCVEVEVMCPGPCVKELGY